MARVYQNWVFTSFEVEPPAYDENTMLFMVYQRETAPTTQKLHWQGYFKAHKRIGFKTAKQIVGNSAHLEVMRGTPKQASDYCLKDETAIEGTRAVFGEIPTHGDKNDMAAWRDAIKAGMSQTDLFENFLPLMLRFSNAYKQMATLYSKKRKYEGDERPVLEFHIGPTGSGKSKTVFEKYPDAYAWSIDNGGGSTWISNYNGEDVIILDEFRGELRFKALKELCGWNPYSFQSKYGDVQILAKKFVFTSTTHPNEWYVDREGEWARRVAEFGVEYKYPVTNL